MKSPRNAWPSDREVLTGYRHYYLFMVISVAKDRMPYTHFTPRAPQLMWVPRSVNTQVLLVLLLV